jgi:protoporphyrinogen oxidase
MRSVLILGGGVTGLAAGIASGLPVYEAQAHAGGICASYYVRPGGRERLLAPPPDDDAFRFEHGGGHWLFGGHPDVTSLVCELAPCDRIARRASVHFPHDGRYVGYPLQHHLRDLEPRVTAAAVDDIVRCADNAGNATTMAEWLEAQFGATLCDLFFHPFHEAYTAGLWRDISPQDGYKNPLDVKQVLRGASDSTSTDAAGYNTTFLYPRNGLDALIRALACRAQVHYEHRVESIDVGRRSVCFANGRELAYERLLATVPLNRMVELARIDVGEAAPYTSVLVLNIGARRGPRTPPDHWVYVPRSRSGFHRVGFYSNVARHFLPYADRERETGACLYVERSFHGGRRPNAAQVARYAAEVVDELQAWGYVRDVDVVDPSWVDVAYTWTRPGSTWVHDALRALAEYGVLMVGRYARWNFQGITDSLRDGFLAGQRLKLH